jgi:precorrin-6B methylase 2
MMLGALSLLPGSRYITLGLLSAALVIYTVNRQRPSHKLARVECAIEVCEETLKYAKSNCARNHLELTDATRQLLE